MLVKVETVQMEVRRGHLDHHLLVIHELSLSPHVRVGDAEPCVRLRMGELRLPNQSGVHMRDRIVELATCLGNTPC